MIEGKMRQLKVDGILNEHNITPYINITKMFENNDRVCIEHATGTGKSFLALQLIYDNPEKQILYLIPKKGIGNQVEEHISSLNDNARQEYFKNLKIQTYQSLLNMTDEELANLKVDYLIVDEYQHVIATKWNLKIQKIIDTHPNLKIFGMSATSKRNFGTLNEIDVSQLFFNDNVASRLTLSDAISKGILKAPHYVSAIYNFDEDIDRIQRKINERNYNEKDRNNYNSMLDNVRRRVNDAYSFNDIIKKYIKLGGKYIIFCPFGKIDEIIEDSKNWTKTFLKEKDIVRYCVYSKQSPTVNKLNFDGFYNNSNPLQTKFMFAMDMYNEGIHVPDIDGVIMMRPTKSDIIFYQQLGRALASNNNKNQPLVIDFVNNLYYINKLKENVTKNKNEYIQNKNNQDKNNDNIWFDIDVNNIDILKSLSKLENSIDLSHNNKILEYIELLNNGYIPKKCDNINKFSNGNIIGYFWDDNKDKINEILFNNMTFDIGYDVAKKVVNQYFTKNSLFSENKIDEFINLLNNGYIPKSFDSETKFSNGLPINHFWMGNKHQIKERLNNDLRYKSNYEIAKKIVNTKLLDKNSDLIELMNQGYIPKSFDDKTKFSSGETIKRYWTDHKKQILDLLDNDEMYKEGYEVAKYSSKGINVLEIKKIIESLNNALKKDINISDKEIKSYLNKNKEIIIDILYNDPNYEKGYDSIKQYFTNIKIDKIAEYIEFLNQGYIPKNTDKNKVFSDKSIVNKFWEKHKEKIKNKLMIEPIYEKGYDLAKQIIKNKEIDKIAEYIELLNKGYIPVYRDLETKFSNGDIINYFWSSHNNKSKIVERLFSNIKYGEGYDVAFTTMFEVLPDLKDRCSSKTYIKKYNL
ncbi:MAG: DEAD/DEAH box helicase family protein [Bacilli bacterium]|nr:DEAD/DEAH box helicase family protein [Bacilli bacterium]